jgi:hypothetical protein
VIGPNEALAVIFALVVSPTKVQLPVNGSVPELFPEWLLFLQATDKRRHMVVAKKEDRFNIANVFVSDNEFIPDLVRPIPPGKYFYINISMTIIFPPLA